MIPSPYFLQPSKRTKRIKITVYCDGTFSVTVPKNTTKDLVKKFIDQKAGWIREKIEFFRKKGFRKYIPIKKNKNEYLQYKNQALILAKERVEYFNKIYNFKYNKITVKNQKTRWGSCSRRGNLNFSYKIALLDQKLADYIIVHEICHLGQFNHSKDFWDLVAKTIPDFKVIRKKLRDDNVF